MSRWLDARTFASVDSVAVSWMLANADAEDDDEDHDHVVDCDDCWRCCTEPDDGRAQIRVILSPMQPWLLSLFLLLDCCHCQSELSVCPAMSWTASYSSKQGQIRKLTGIEKSAKAPWLPWWITFSFSPPAVRKQIWKTNLMSLPYRSAPGDCAVCSNFINHLAALWS